MQHTFTILDGVQPRELAARVDGDRGRLDPAAVQAVLGWELKPEGLCRGSVCIPVRDRDALVDDDGLDLATLAAHLDRPLAVDPEERVAALGTDHLSRAHDLNRLEAPDFELPDVDGTLHRLSELRGRKVLLIAYASW